MNKGCSLKIEILARDIIVRSFEEKKLKYQIRSKLINSQSQYYIVPVTLRLELRNSTWKWCYLARAGRGLLEIRREGWEDEERVRMTESLQICSDNRHLWYAEDINCNQSQIRITYVTEQITKSEKTNLNNNFFAVLREDGTRMQCEQSTDSLTESINQKIIGKEIYVNISLWREEETHM